MIDIWQKRIDHGVDLMAQIAQVLNNIIEESGPIDINNKTIWDGYLHRWSNEDWISVLWVLKNLMSQSPELFKPFHIRMIDDAIDALHQDQGQPRVLDSHKNKRKAWGCIMTMREIWNAANNINLPNQ